MVTFVIKYQRYIPENIIIMQTFVPMTSSYAQVVAVAGDDGGDRTCRF